MIRQCPERARKQRELIRTDIDKLARYFGTV